MLGQINLSLARRTMLRQLGYGMDLDGTTENLQITNPKNVYSGEYSLRADFSGDVVGQAPANWTVSSGAYQVKSDNPSPFGGIKYLECTTAGVISIPCNQAYGRWEFDVLKGGENNSVNLPFLASAQSAVSNGYRFRMSSTEHLQIRREPVGAPILVTADSYIANLIWYRIKIERLTNGQFALYVKGGSFGDSYILVSVSGGAGTNPTVDNTYTSSNYFVLDFTVGDRIANITCEHGTGSFDLSGYERIFHSGNRDFETPVALGPELITNGGALGQTDWIDSNADGLADGWGFYVAPDAVSTIVTGNGFTGNAQRIANNSGVNKDVLSINNLTAGKCYRISLKFRSSHNLLVNSGDYAWATPVNLGVNTGNAKYVEFDAFVNRTTLTFRNNTAGGWYEIDEVSAKELKSDWTEKGNHTCYITGEDKKSGSFCLKMISTGAGDANNCITLAPDKFKAVTPTDKFTFEGYARGIGILGSEKLANGAFEGTYTNGLAPAWNKSGNPTVSQETGVTGSAQGITNGGTGDVVEQGISVIAGRTYKITATGKVISGTGGGYVRLIEPYYVPSTNVLTFIETAWTTKTFTFVASATGPTVIRLFSPAGTLTAFDNVSFQEVTLPSITILTGSKQKTITGITCIPGMAANATKAVFNFEATAAEISQGIKIWANQADTIYFDEITYKQRFDVAVSSWVKATRLTDNSQYTVFANNTIRGGLSLYLRNIAIGDFGIGINQNSMGGTIAAGTYTEYGKWALVTFICSYPNIKLYVNGQIIIDKPYDNFDMNTPTINEKVLYIGYAFDTVSPKYFTGQMGEFQWSRFNNIALSDFDGSKYFKNQIPRKYTGGGALVCLHLKFKGPDDATFLKDYSPLQQLVTGVNVTRAGDQVRGAYPYYSR